MKQPCPLTPFLFEKNREGEQKMVRIEAFVQVRLNAIPPLYPPLPRKRDTGIERGQRVSQNPQFPVISTTILISFVDKQGIRSKQRGGRTVILKP